MTDSKDQNPTPASASTPPDSTEAADTAAIAPAADATEQPEAAHSAAPAEATAAAAAPVDATAANDATGTPEAPDAASVDPATAAATATAAGAARAKKAAPVPPPAPATLSNPHAQALYDRGATLAGAASIDEQELKSLRRDITAHRDDAAANPEDLALIDAQLENATTRRHRQLEQREKQLAIVMESLDSLDAAIAAGNLKDAQSLEQKVTARLANVAELADAKRKEITARIDTARPKIKELKDWRNWGTSQARDKLIASMEELVTSKLTPPQIAAEIRRARETWQGWDKSGDQAGKAMWDRFDAACTAAYEPCKSWFEQQNIERTNNLAAREALCAKLEAIAGDTDWESPPWRDVDKAVMAVRNEWRKAGPVDRKKRKSIDKRYDAALAAVQEPLDVERKRSIKLRESLIETVKALSEEEDVRKATDGVRDAQKKWKPTVLAHHRVERKMWNEFKTLCDGIYDRRKATAKARDAEFASNLEARDQVIRQIEELASAEDSAVMEGAGQLAKLRQNYFDAGQVSRKDQNGVEKRFKGAIKTFEKRVSGIKRERALARQSQMDALAALCTAAENLIGTDSPDDRLVALETEWSQQELEDDKTTAALKERFETSIKAARGDADVAGKLTAQWQTNQKEREDICLELEVRAEIDSPAQYAAARMELQVQRLAAAMGKGQKDNKIGSTKDLLDAWLTIGPAPPEVSQLLQQRFERARAAIKNER